MAKWWSCRVDHIEGSDDWLLNGLDDLSIRWVCSREIARETKKLHYHAVFSTKFSESKIRQKLFMPQLGRKEKSLHLILDEKELKKALQYTCKGSGPEFQLVDDPKNPKLFAEAQRPFNPDIVGRCSYSNSDIEEIHREYWRINQETKKEYKEIKQKKNFNFVAECALQICEIKDAGETAIEFDSRSWQFRKFVRKIIYKNLREKAKTFDAIIVRRLQNGIMNIIDPQHMEEYMESLIDDSPDV